MDSARNYIIECFDHYSAHIFSQACCADSKRNTCIRFVQYAQRKLKLGWFWCFEILAGSGSAVSDTITELCVRRHLARDCLPSRLKPLNDEHETRLLARILKQGVQLSEDENVTRMKFTPARCTGMLTLKIIVEKPIVMSTILSNDDCEDNFNFSLQNLIES